MKLFLELSLLFILILTASEAKAGQEPPDPLQAAERAFSEGRFQDTLDRLAELPDVPQHKLRVWFLRAYAHFKLQHFDQARETLDRLLQENPTTEAVFLRGMIAIEQRQWAQALKFLHPLIQSDTPPWTEMVKPLLKRVAAEQAAAQAAQERLQREERIRQYRGKIARVEALLKAKKYAETAQAIEAAEVLNPGHYLTAYYRGYLSYQQGHYPVAITHLNQALIKEPADSWSRYMLAMAQNASGDSQRARGLLLELSTKAEDGVVRQAASRALKHQGTKTSQGNRGPRVKLGSGFVLDTNPDSFKERPANKISVTPALSVVGSAAYGWLLARRFQVEVGLQLSERAYLNKQTQADLFEASAGLGLGVLLPNGSINLRYDYSFQMYHYNPLGSLHHVALEGLFALRPWIDLGVAGRLTLQDVQYEEFAYLPHLGGEENLGFRFHLGPLELETTYGLRQDQADPVQMALYTVNSSGKGPQGNTKTSTGYTLNTNYTAWGHGPVIWASLDLPWRLTLSAGATVTWLRFAHEGSLVQQSNGQTSTISPREDTRLNLEAELGRAFALGLELALRYDSVDNFSSVALPNVGLDHNYSQRGVSLWLRWHWGV